MKKKIKIGLFCLMVGIILFGGWWIFMIIYSNDDNLEPVENIIRKNPVECESNNDCEWRCCGRAVNYGYKCTNVNDTNCHECPTKDDPNRPPALLPCTCVDHKCIGAHLTKNNLEFEFSRCEDCGKGVENTIGEIKWDRDTLLINAVIMRNACADYLEGVHIIDGDTIKIDAIEKGEHLCWSLSFYKTIFKIKNLQKKDYKIQLVDDYKVVNDEKMITVN